jgi:hypothetical protein
VPNWRRWRPKVAADPDRYELHYEDETHLETNPYLARRWHRRGEQPTVPAAGTNRRVTCFGSVEALGRGRVAVVGVGQDSVRFADYLTVLEQRHQETGRDVILVLDNGSCHTSVVSRAALATRRDWLQIRWLPRYIPQLNPIEREWRWLKRDCRSHLAQSLRAFVDEILVGLQRLGGLRQDIVDQVPQWFLDGHKREPTGRPLGRPTGAIDSYPRRKPTANVPAHA